MPPATYLVVGFGLVEAADLVGPTLRLPEETIGLLLAALILGFPPAMAGRWIYAGRSSESSVAAAGPLASLAVITGLCVWLGVRALESTPADLAEEAGEPPLVVLMDSHPPARVYDEETRAANATNADVLSDVLLDLPIRRQRESIGPEWHRDQEILQFGPDLVVNHYSGFRQEDGTGPRERLKLFISFFADSDPRFLIYSRAVESELREAVDLLLADVEEASPGLLDRITVFGLFDYSPPSWRSPLTTGPLKLRVKEILGIP